MLKPFLPHSRCEDKLLGLLDRLDCYLSQSVEYVYFAVNRITNNFGRLNRNVTIKLFLFCLEPTVATTDKGNSFTTKIGK